MQEQQKVQTMVQRSINLPSEIDDKLRQLSVAQKRSKNDLITEILSISLQNDSLIFKALDSPHNGIPSERLHAIASQALRERELSLLNNLKAELPKKISLALANAQFQCVLYEFKDHKHWLYSRPDNSDSVEHRVAKQLISYLKANNYQVKLSHDYVYRGPCTWSVTIEWKK